MSSRFARQFGYDQLYISNPNLELAYKGSLLDGERAWNYNFTVGTEATFELPLQTPKFNLSLNFYKQFSAIVQSQNFGWSPSCLRYIQAKYVEKIVSPHATSVMGLVEFRPAVEEELKKRATTTSQPAAQEGQPAHRAHQCTKKQKGGNFFVIRKPHVVPPTSEVVWEEPVQETQKLKESTFPHESSPKRPRRDEGGSCAPTNEPGHKKKKKQRHHKKKRREDRFPSPPASNIVAEGIELEDGELEPNDVSLIKISLGVRLLKRVLLSLQQVQALLCESKHFFFLG